MMLYEFGAQEKSGGMMKESFLKTSGGCIIFLVVDHRVRSGTGKTKWEVTTRENSRIGVHFVLVRYVPLSDHDSYLCLRDLEKWNSFQHLDLFNGESYLCTVNVFDRC